MRARARAAGGTISRRFARRRRVSLSSVAFRFAQSTMTRKIRILLADDHAVVRQGFRLILNQEPDMEVVGEAGDGAGSRAPRPAACGPRW